MAYATANVNLNIPEISTKTTIYVKQSLPTVGYTMVGRTTSDTFTNKTIIDPSNNVAAGSLLNGTNVAVLGSIAPMAGQVLTATSSNALSWITPGGDGLSQLQQVYVNAGGSDTTGNGSQGNPYATISKALTMIVDATPFKRYSIMVGPGNYTDNFSLKANVGITGQFQLITRIGGQININDPSWNDPAGNNDNRSGFTNVALTGSSLTFDFTAQASGAGKLYFQNTSFNVGPTFTAYSDINQVRLTSCYSFAGYTLTGCNSQMFQCYNQGGVISMVSSPNCSTLLEAQDGVNEGTLSISYTAANIYTVSCTLIGMVQRGAIAVSGASASLSATSDSISIASGLPTVTSGGTFTMLSDVKGIAYTPATASNWGATVPTTLQQAIDLLAAKVAPV